MPTAVWVSTRPAPVLPALPPAKAGGAFVVTGADGSTSAPLPAADWRTNAAGTLCKFVNKLTAGGSSPCKAALVKGGKVLRIACKDSVVDADDATQGTVGVALTIREPNHCAGPKRGGATFAMARDRPATSWDLAIRT